MRVRDWSGIDHYAELGVSPTATREEITVAYRAQARVLHPDAGSVDPDDEARFVRITAAYRILTGPQREAYDRARRQGRTAAAGSAPAVPARPAPWRLSRRGARAALIGGIALVIAGIAVAVGLVALHAHDARLRSEGVAATAVVVSDGGTPALEFVDQRGDLVVAALPDARSGRYRVRDEVAIRYDRADPTRVVTVASTTARDVTLWIVVVKFVVVGFVLTVVGARRLRRAD